MQHDDNVTEPCFIDIIIIVLMYYFQRVTVYFKNPRCFEPTHLETAMHKCSQMHQHVELRHPTVYVCFI